MPKADPIVNARAIERVPVEESRRTPDKAEAAEWIENMWPATLSEIAEASGYSRQHIKNTLVDYFRIADAESESQNVRMEKPNSDLQAAYRAGYRDGWRDAKAADEETPIDESDIRAKLAK